MTDRLLSRQRGLSFISLVLVAALVASAAILLARVVPSLLEYQAVRRGVEQSARAASPTDIRAAFDRIAQVEEISSVGGKDLEILRGATEDQWAVRFAYQREFHLFGPAWLTLKYSGGTR